MRGNQHAEYRELVEQTLSSLSEDSLDRALAIARVPELIRGYGHVKAASVVAAKAKWSALQLEAAARTVTSEEM